MFELHLIGEAGGKRLAPIGVVPLLVGRSATNDVVLDDERVSGRHLRLWTEGASVLVRDLGSRNGTEINGQRLANDAVVVPGDDILLGEALLLQIVEVQALPEEVRPAVPAVLVAALQTLPATVAGPALAAVQAGAEALDGAHHGIHIVETLVRAGRRSAVLQIVVDEARRITQVPSIAALVWSEGGDRTVRATARTDDFTRLFPVDGVSTSIVERVLTEGQPLWSDDANLDERLADKHSVQALALRSVGCVPLGANAVLYLSDPTAGKRFPSWVRARIEGVCAVARPFVERESVGAVPAEALPGMVGVSDAMADVFDNVRAFAPMPWPMLILGETGTGKERVAGAIHALSGREGPFVAFNCGALSDELALSQLFGHEAGAFTGADKRHTGYLERAGTGTLFLDEVGELSPIVQARLLRVLQEGTFERLGSEKTTAFRARTVAATHRGLEKPESRGAFRDDLYHRLAACVVRVPPLRERAEDIAPLAEHLLGRLLGELPESHRARARLELAAEALRLLASRPWPGNVRELENAIRSAVARCLARKERLIRPEHFDGVGDKAPEHDDDLKMATLAFQVRRVREMLEGCGGNRAEAARRLGVSRQSLYRLLDRVDGDA